MLFSTEISLNAEAESKVTCIYIPELLRIAENTFNGYMLIEEERHARANQQGST